MNNTNDIRDIKPPIEIPNGWEVLWIALAVLGLLGILLLAWWLWKKSRLGVAIESLVPAHIRAKLDLRRALEIISQPKSFCILVSDTIRRYLEERFNFSAPDRTTEEFLRELGETDLLTATQKESLSRFLESCDLVKFAKYEPAENELRELHSQALQLVEETEPREISNGAPPARGEQEQTINNKS
jgi:hypothetical protein